MSKRIKFVNGNMIEYEIRQLVDFYDPILRQPTVPFDFTSKTSRKDAEFIAYTLAETMSHYGGLGLSANQIGLKDRVCAINMGKEAWTMFNPEIIDHNFVPAQYSEGCLSYRGLYIKCNRYDHINVRFQAIGGEFIEQEFNGLTAVCVQHEIDHLNGIVFTDRISPINLEKAKRKVKSNLKKMGKIGVDVSY
jgi:peptide deformylase